jgi:ectoine hydroxylase
VTYKSEAAVVPPLSPQDFRRFNSDGFLLRRGFFDAEEVQYLERAYEDDPAIQRRTVRLGDGEGGQTEIALWNEPGEDVFGAVARCARMVDAAEQLLGDEVYHYHSKINVKQPGGGGVWLWHQDYGYWYDNGCLYPDMLTVAIPLTPMTSANGCLRVIPTTNRMGRIEHLRIGDQTGADPERVKEILGRVEAQAFEASPGDVLFFHCNTLHGSAPNLSDVPRHLLLVAYNSRHNEPYRAHHHPGYHPIDKLPDSAIKERRDLRDGESRMFMPARGKAGGS